MYPSLRCQRINRRSLEDRGGRATTTTVAVSGGRQSPPPLAGIDLASRGLAAAATATAAAALKSSSPPEAESKHHHHHQLIRDHKGSADHPGLYAGHRKSNPGPASPPTPCSSNASHAEVKKLRERYFDDAAAVHGSGPAERGYGIGKMASSLFICFPVNNIYCNISPWVSHGLEEKVRSTMDLSLMDV